ncbi:hypothetical protein QUC31_019708 [Theobroma cacao]|uniref:Uncharacterized protein n=2 Tax=Theobroma cacao TaxID=3641 RepID=A0A061GPZ1_THECC|nr:PREDICTED: uncharacterized protein LOC18589095 [Theobroma cacao]EOY31596.1 Uncharacterized protein TCM_038566 [Theobroma cacao]
MAPKLIIYISSFGKHRISKLQIFLALDMKKACFLSMNQRTQRTRMYRLVLRKKVKFVKVSVHRNLCTLRRIVPGCEEADLETMFQRSIEHIIKLKSLVYVLRSLANSYGV